MSDADRKIVEARRKELVDAVANALAVFIAAGAKIEVLEFSHHTAPKDADKSPAWVFFEIAVMAMAKVNADRVTVLEKAIDGIIPEIR